MRCGGSSGSSSSSSSSSSISSSSSSSSRSSSRSRSYSSQVINLTDSESELSATVSNSATASNSAATAPPGGRSAWTDALRRTTTTTATTTTTTSSTTASSTASRSSKPFSPLDWTCVSCKAIHSDAIHRCPCGFFVPDIPEDLCLICQRELLGMHAGSLYQLTQCCGCWICIECLDRLEGFAKAQDSPTTCPKCRREIFLASDFEWPFKVAEWRRSMELSARDSPPSVSGALEPVN